MVKNERSIDSRTVFHYRIQHAQTHHRQAQACNASAPKLGVKQMKVYDLTQKTDPQHVFVICYDPNQNLWYHETDVEDDVLPDGTIWNENTRSWQSGYLGDGEYLDGVEDCAIALHKALTYLNEQVQV
jgi:hypothetical protein